MATIKCKGKVLAYLNWFGVCEFSFFERDFGRTSLRENDKLTLCIRVKRVEHLGYPDLDAIVSVLEQEQLSPSAEDYVWNGEDVNLIYIYSSENILRPDRFLQSLARKMSNDIEWYRDVSAGEEAMNAAISIEEGQQIRLADQHREFFATD